MKVEINLFASLSRYARYSPGSDNNRILDVSEGTTIIELLNYLKVPMDKVKLIFLNGVHASGNEILHEGDRIGVFPPVAGG